MSFPDIERRRCNWCGGSGRSDRHSNAQCEDCDGSGCVEECDECGQNPAGACSCSCSDCGYERGDCVCEGGGP